MKHLKLFCIILSCLSSSCEQLTPISQPSDEEVFVELNFTLKNDEADSKIPTYESDTRIVNLYAFVFKTSNNRLISSRQATETELQNKTMTLQTNYGERDIYLVANATESDLISFRGVENLSDLKSIKADLINIQDGKLPMLGKLESLNISQYSAKNLPIFLYRLASRIHLRDIICKFNGELETSSLEILSVYLIDPGAYCSYGDPSLEFAPQPDYSQMENNYATYDPSCSITNARSFAAQRQDGVYMYSYQHNKTTLIIKAKLESEIMYYTVPLYTLEHNHRYEITVTITGKGTSSPNIATAECTGTIVIDDWTTVSRTITF